MKTAERAHTPKNLWERIKLSKDYKKALKQVDEHLLYWNKFMIHKCKQRLTRLTQVAITERRLALREDERHYVGVKHKVKRREETRERKALAAARIEKAIEKELLERLKSGAYGDHPLNVDSKIWKKVLGKVEEREEEEESDYDSNDEVELESDMEDESDVGEVEYVEAEEDDDEMVDMEDLQKWLEDGSDASSSDSEDDDEDDHKPQERRKRPRIEIEYEEEPLTNIAS
ncbi:hypothetical protein OGAPHI_000814 [Ogataea philodendri]|uniref:Protein MAK16 n=1 Tax=Ogataea philodendri TaxID=1378263 RepID=A0A9P8T990_9ASCO|nr:uncharacterized protein OGAPHI_000814 [Ogataea philodendri]KAH3671103.1 hypothetical protein OGAPHI_000814 [Ogataea philodendri]